MDEPALLRFAANAMPTCENSRSTAAPSISGDLWSESGMGLFGIFAHGITETWVMEKALIGLVACEKERHTAANIKKWTNDALEAIGITTEKLLGV